MGFDHGHTCPDIDRGIKSIKDSFFSTIENLLIRINGEELCPESIADHCSDLSYCLYQDVEAEFEGVRTSNEDMRKDADYQISNLEDRIENLEWQVQDLEQQVESLNAELEACETA